MKNKTIIIFTVVVLVAIAGLFAANAFLKKNVVGIDSRQNIGTQENLAPSIVVPEQAGGKNIFIESVTLEDNGYVVIHEDNDGNPGQIIAVSGLLPVGIRNNFLMDIDKEVFEGDSLFAMIHTDDGDGIFDAALDAPAKDTDGNIVLVGFLIVSESALGDEIKL